MIPIVMAGVIGIYGLIVGVILAQSITKPDNNRNNVYSIYTAMAHVSLAFIIMFYFATHGSDPCSLFALLKSDNLSWRLVSVAASLV